MSDCESEKFYEESWIKQEKANKAYNKKKEVLYNRNKCRTEFHGPTPVSEDVWILENKNISKWYGGAEFVDVPRKTGKRRYVCPCCETPLRRWHDYSYCVNDEYCFFDEHARHFMYYRDSKLNIKDNYIDGTIYTEYDYRDEER